MPNSTIGFFGLEVIPANFGMWSGPGYASGRLVGASDPNGQLFIDLYKTVNAVGFKEQGDTTRYRTKFSENGYVQTRAGGDIDVLLAGNDDIYRRAA